MWVPGLQILPARPCPSLGAVRQLVCNERAASSDVWISRGALWTPEQGASRPA
jgi:hypothetical protein